MQWNGSEGRLKTAHLYFKISSSNFNEYVVLKKILGWYERIELTIHLYLNFKAKNR